MFFTNTIWSAFARNLVSIQIPMIGCSVDVYNQVLWSNGHLYFHLTSSFRYIDFYTKQSPGRESLVYIVFISIWSCVFYKLFLYIEMENDGPTYPYAVGGAWLVTSFKYITLEFVYTYSHSHSICRSYLYILVTVTKAM